MELEEIVKRFAGKKLIVIGDVMLDKYIHGKVSRMSPEAPVQIMDVMREECVPGGAANAAANASALGAQAYLIGVVGKDSESRYFEQAANEKKIIYRRIEDATRRTTCKVRMIGYNLQSRNQQLLRMDYEDTQKISKNIEEEIINTVYNKICFGSFVPLPEAIVFSDYAKGVLTESVVHELIEFAREKKIPTIAAPKPENKELYKNVGLLIMNKSEAREMSGISSEKIEEIGYSLLNYFSGDIIITRGPEGVAAFRKNEACLQVPTKTQKVSDVTGAGDTFAAAAALAMASGASLHQIVTIANHAAGIAVSKPGTATVSVDELLYDLKNNC